MNHSSFSLVYIIAGEPSGDFIGSNLIKQLKLLNPDIRIVGIGGDLMQKEGVKTLFDIKHISIMGIFEILPNIFKLLQLIKKTSRDILEKKPDILLTIDSPGFNLKVAKIIKKKCNNKIKLIHYVAPSVWAYKPKRAKKFAKVFNYLLCLLPFEPKYFIKEKLPAFFVGHPIVESKIATIMKHRKVSSTNKSNNKILLLPGSREKEVKALLPLFLNVANNVKKYYSDLQIVIATIPTLYDLVLKISKEYKDITVSKTEEEKYKSFLETKIALAASGTVTLELALAKIRTVVAYKMNFLTTLILSLILKIKFASLINIMANKAIFPEVLGYNCTVKKVSEVSLNMIDNKLDEETINNILYQLGYNNFIPSKKSAEVILKIINTNK